MHDECIICVWTNDDEEFGVSGNNRKAHNFNQVKSSNAVNKFWKKRKLKIKVQVNEFIHFNLKMLPNFS